MVLKGAKQWNGLKKAKQFMLALYVTAKLKLSRVKNCPVIANTAKQNLRRDNCVLLVLF
jgi:hypothetical protein